MITPFKLIRTVIERVFLREGEFLSRPRFITLLYGIDERFYEEVRKVDIRGN